ncbi:hypothetical protein [Streptomyces sp. NPDC050535]|uniref:hypothetical protein n=1 Tax=Streptomyces sp. NPDC050535 TaxID=3365626 RepID=UPI0037BA3FE2
MTAGTGPVGQSDGVDDPGGLADEQAARYDQAIRPPTAAPATPASQVTPAPAREGVDRRGA